MFKTFPVWNTVPFVQFLFKKVSCLCRTESFGFEDEEAVSCGSNGGRRESNGRTRTKDPCLGKMALGEIRMIMKVMMEMLMITIENQDQDKMTRWRLVR